MSEALTIEIPVEEAARADIYDLLALLLSAPPSARTLKAVAALEGGADESGRAAAALARMASATSIEAASREYHALFIGLGRGELLPFGSYYMTGFLNEKPLARLRNDMMRLRIARGEGVFEPEDHIAQLCEMMAGLIRGRFGDPADLMAQETFFNAHLAPWAGHFFSDLEAAKASALYAPLGRMGGRFMEIEREAFRMNA